MDRDIHPTIKLIEVIPETTDLRLSDNFWDYFTSRFESASIEIFMTSGLPYPPLLADTSYDFGTITNWNRAELLKYLPVNLSEKERFNYTEERTLRLPKDDPDFTIDSVPRRWQNASQQDEKDYVKFRQLLSDTTNDYILIMKKSYRKRIMMKLESMALDQKYNY